MFIDINQIEKKNIGFNEVGNKAYNLCKLYDMEKNYQGDYFEVADGFVIPVKEFIGIVESNGIIYQDIKLNNLNDAAKFHERIKTLKLSDVFLKELEKRVDKLYFPLIVRSSSPYEDSDNSSMAGLYLSINNVNNFEDLIKSILEVWASAYYNKLTIHKPIGVIVQKHLPSNLGGVIFSKHPNKLGLYYGEYSINGVESVVNGEENYSFEIDKKGNSIEEVGVLEPYLGLLAKITKELVNIFKGDIDIEWLIYDDKIYILQVRPITSFYDKEEIVDFRIVDTEDSEALNNIDMKNFYHKYMKWFDKRNMLRNLCKTSSISVPIAKYVFYNKNNINIEEIKNVFEGSDILKVESTNEIRTLIFSNLKKYLEELNERTNSKIDIVRIQQITPTEKCGNACLLEDNTIYIEIMEGGFAGFLSGELDFSRYIISSNKEIIKKDLVNYEYIWKFNEEKRKFVKTYLDEPIVGMASDKIIDQIVDMVIKLNSNISNIKIEFEVAEDIVYFNDATLDDTIITLNNANNRAISPGDFEGSLNFISKEDIDNMKKQLGSRSVIAESEFLIKSEKFLKSNPKFLKNEKSVLVAPYPDPSLSVLIDYYNGFIFEKGGLLSHLAIILREQGKPAMIISNIYDYVDEKEVNVSNEILRFNKK